MPPSNTKRIPKSIRPILSRARKGDIRALFQLAQYYQHGEYVEQDEQQAKLYFAKTLELFQQQSLQFLSLKLVDFRLYEKLDIDFCNQYQHGSNLTVIIGNNGAGKTTILEALAKSLSWLINSIRSNKDSGRGDVIDELDINNRKIAEYASIISQFQVIQAGKYELGLSKPKIASQVSKKNVVENIKQLADIYKLAHAENTQFSFPIMAFYSAERAMDITKKDIVFDPSLDQKNWNKLDAYEKDTLNGKGDFKLFVSWFKYLNDVNNSYHQENQEVLLAIHGLETELKFIVEMEGQAATDANGSAFLQTFKQQKQDEIAQLKTQITNSSPIQSSAIIKHVTDAIYTFMPEFSDFRIQLSPFAVLITKNDIVLNILQLSQGEKSLLALVADIARRLVLLNPALNNPLKGNGIVLIDEIDLHLHPKWQQSVIPSLLKTFPNVQFIVTTHSPQVLTTVPRQCIRILKDGKVLKASVSSLGEESRTTLEDIMDTDSRPQDLMSEKLRLYLKKIARGDIDSQEVLLLREELEQHYGQSFSQLELADMEINRHLAIRKNKKV